MLAAVRNFPFEHPFAQGSHLPAVLEVGMRTWASEVTLDEARQRLVEAISAAPSLRQWARAHGVDSGDASGAITGSRPMRPSILRALGIPHTLTINRWSSFDAMLENATPEPNTGCLLWMGPWDPDGYGVASAKKALGTNAAHRVAFMLATNIRLTPDQLLLHRCDTPPCISPGHLRVGTPADNVHDCIDRDRAAYAQAWKDGRCSQGHDITDPNNVRVRQDAKSVGGFSRECVPCARSRDRIRKASR